MTATVTAEELRQQKKQCLHIIDIEKALTRLEDNADYKILTDFLFKENLSANVKYAFSIHTSEESRKGAMKLAKSLSRVNEYITNLHAVARNCSEQIPDLDKAIFESESERGE